MLQAIRVKTDFVQDFIEFSLAWLAERNYTLSVDVNMAGWAKNMGQAPSIALVNPTFDPKFNSLSPDNSFWLDVRSGSHTIAMMASRLFLTNDYLELKRSLRVWYDQPPRDEAPLAIAVPADTPTIRGKVGHEGGLWVHPQHRKRGLSVILPHLNRALAFRQWNMYWQTGLALRGVGESGIINWAYGVPHMMPCYEGRLPLTGRFDRLFIAYMSRDEIVAGLDLDAVTRLLPDGYRQARYSPALVQKR